MDIKKLAAFKNRKTAKPTIPAHDVEEEMDSVEAGGDDEAVSDAEIVQHCGAEVQSGKGDAQLEQLMASYDPTDGKPDWATDDALWQQSVEAVDPDGEGDSDWDDPWMVVAHVYKAIGGEVDAPEAEAVPEIESDEEEAPEDENLAESVEA